MYRFSEVISVDKTVHEKNYEQWSGLSENYHDSRPVPPEIITKIILTVEGLSKSVKWLKERKITL